ncbi:MAG: cytochrome-c peroxidase [Chitinophagales bacterium]|nr:cytochrome-c peroxidase [Chitinophagales bacterium]
MHFKLNVIVSLILFSLITSCKKESKADDDLITLKEHLNIPNQVYNYRSPNIPAFYSNQFIVIQDNTPADNPTSNWGATLGRVLFYDPILSRDLSTACASCHQQAIGFTDTAQFSTGINGQTTLRHSMALGNSMYYLNGRFLWDERAATLEEQVLQPIQDPLEMGMTLSDLAERLQATAYYPILFRKAFPDGEMNSENIAKALAQFIRSMVSYGSKFDQGRALVNDVYQDFPNYTIQENLGKSIFTSHNKVNCFGCHNTEALITDNPRNNGLYKLNPDIGISIHSNNPSDAGKFKAPSLKNVALRGRFMHDGSLKSLREVIKHYDGNIKDNENLDPHLIDVFTNYPVVMNLSIQETDALEAFLHTLTDEQFINSPKYSDPFY